MHDTSRIIDANANRVREALRVMEEAARFIINDTTLTEQLKRVRHDFTSAIVPMSDAIFWRDTPGDVGTTLSTDAEQTRSDLGGVILASGARLCEALRVIEEYAKVESNDNNQYRGLATTAERLRYQAYDLTQKLVTALGSSRARQYRLCLLLSEALCVHRPWGEVLGAAVSHGVDMVQVREKEMGDRQLLDRVIEARSIIDGRATLIVNDRPDIALLGNADGVHLGQSDVAPAQARKVIGRERLIGVSTSSLDQAREAKRGGADYCGVGPMFPTTTKHKPELAGPAYLREFVAWGGLPHLAIGGIGPNNVGELTVLGCRGVAVSAAICSATDPGAATASLAQTLKSAVTSRKA